MVKTIRCDFTGEEVEEEEAYTIAVTYRVNNQLHKLELDADPSWVSEHILKTASAVRKGKTLPWNRWVTPTKDEQQKGVKGHFERVS